MIVHQSQMKSNKTHGTKRLTTKNKPYINFVSDKNGEIVQATDVSSHPSSLIQHLYTLMMENLPDLCCGLVLITVWICKYCTRQLKTTDNDKKIFNVTHKRFGWGIKGLAASERVKNKFSCHKSSSYDDQCTKYIMDLKENQKKTMPEFQSIQIMVSDVIKEMNVQLDEMKERKQDCSDRSVYCCEFMNKISSWKTGGEPTEIKDTLAELADSLLLGKYNNLNNYLRQQDFLESSNVIQNGYKSTINLCRRVIENETFRVMKSIDMVASQATQLFGHKKTQIFFDLIDVKLLDFESPVIGSEFVLNMALYAVRQHVLSFFIHADDIMNNLMLLLCCCPDSESLQKMTEKEFRSLMEHVIDSSSLKTKSNKGAKPSLKGIKGIKWIMVDSDLFMREVGGEISEDILDRHGRGDEMIVHKFIDSRRRPSDGKDNRPLHSIYFPSDNQLFIYIPTENGSYWHQLDLQRASRIHRQN